MADQDHQLCVIAVDHTSTFKVIWSLLNPPLMVYNTGNGASFQKLRDQSQISGKMLEIEKKESKTLNTFQKILH